MKLYQDELLLEKISLGLQFIERTQFPAGRFPGYRTEDGRVDIGNCIDEISILFTDDNSPFYTAAALCSLCLVDDGRARDIIRKGIKYLLGEMEYPGLWKYWRSDPMDLPYDLDLIALASHVISDDCISIQYGWNERVFLENRNKPGFFLTWINPEDYHYQWKNDVCGVVNANVVLYLGERPETRPAIGLLISIIHNHREKVSTRYYPNPLCLYHAISRAFYSGVTSLGVIKKEVIRKILQFRKGNGSFGDDLSTALAVSSLLNFGYSEITTLGPTIQYQMNRP